MTTLKSLLKTHLLNRLQEISPANCLSLYMHLRACSPSPDSPTQEHSYPSLQLGTTGREREGETPLEDHSEHLRFNVIELLIIHKKRIIQSFLVRKIYSPSPI